MERRGGGLEKIVTETEKAPGYTDALKPSFFSTDYALHVVLKNVNYIANQQENPQDSIQELALFEINERILAFCKIARSRREFVKTVTIRISVILQHIIYSH